MAERHNGRLAATGAPEGFVPTSKEDNRELIVQGGRFEVAGLPARGLRVGADRLLIGRAMGCALPLAHDTVSAVHAEVQATTKGVRLLDRNSTNGTFLGPPGAEARITEVFLTRPCVGRFGKCSWRFDPDAPQTLVLEDAHRFGGLVGATSEMRSLFASLRRYADQPQSIVIGGETGTGKERVARAIHDASSRRNRPFMAINCGAVPENLIESELFGVTKGAFTGADCSRPGLLVEADGGTVLFDEVAEMSKAMQAKLLRVLERQEVRPLGGGPTRRIDVRTLFASNVDLRVVVDLDRFRQDLYFRIAQAIVEIPPLRERRDDVPLLVRDILADLRHSHVRVDKAALSLLRARTWPGNVRELANVLQATLPAMRDSDVISASIVQDALLATRAKSASRSATSSSDVAKYEVAKQDFDLEYYAELNVKHDGNISRIANETGRHRGTVRRILDQLGLRRIPTRSAPPRPTSAAAGGTIPRSSPKR